MSNLRKFRGDYYYDPDNPSVVKHRSELHVPATSLVLTSNPPQYYCSKEGCYSHRCDFEGWSFVD